MDDTRYSLFQLNALIRESIEQALPDEYWVEAELSEVRESRGHCYMELIEKSDDSNTPIAKAAAKCWRSQWLMLRPYFERATGQTLHAGMRVLLKVYPQFHENYGFSWIVVDIDPKYTLGDMARKRMEIIQTLKDEGVFDLNKQLTLSPFAQRIAVVTSATAAGYGDFCNQLTSNEYGFVFSTQLFPSVMQGEGVEQSVISALDAINASMEDFDVVVIIRGGGATSDMSGFDTLLLAENVANFPLPVITGIGHERDECVLDMISHTRVKTPTAAAAFLIENLAQTQGRISRCGQMLTLLARRRLETERLRLMPLRGKVSSAAKLSLTTANHRLQLLQQRLKPLAGNRLLREKQHLSLLQQKLDLLNPELLLNRGYSITLVDGKIVRTVSQVKPGDRLETRLQQGKIYSKVE